MTNNLSFGDTKIIGENNRLEKIEKFGEIEVRGLSISTKNPGVISKIPGGVELDSTSIGKMEMLKYNGKEFQDYEGKKINEDSFDIIAEYWEFSSDKSKITILDEFIIFQL